MKKEVGQISEAELEVMKILWEKENATSQQIIDELAKVSDWKPKTIHTLITRLVNKNAIAADKTNPKAFLYEPLITKEEYQAYANQSFLQKVYNGSLKMMLAAFVKEQNLSKEDVKELKKLLESEDKP